MADALLVPAYPALIRRGLPLVWRRDDGSESDPVLCMEPPDEYTPKMWTENGYGGHLYPDVEHDNADGYWLDLRVPSVRDACLRALWAKLRPEWPESFAAPQWVPHDDDATPSWSLAVFDGDGDSESIYFAEFIGNTAPDGSMAVPALADCYVEDADLLALAAVLTHVFGGGRG